MILKKQSPLTGMWNEMELDITEEQLQEYEGSGQVIQKVFPHLNPEEREFIITGYTPEDWDKIFGGLEENGHFG